MRQVIKPIFLSISLAVALLSCKKDETTTNDNAIPETFRVDIPDAISGTSSLKSTTSDSLKGGEVYRNLRTFINVGEKASEIVQNIMTAIRKNNINKAMELTYKSSDDQRDKRLKVIENVEFGGKSYQFQLTITDVQKESNADGGKALQVFWNNKPVDGIAILSFANINNNDAVKYPNFMASIEYNELNARGYEQEMTVSLSGYPLQDTATDRYSLQTLKMFAGKKGDVIDVYGNSNHPNARFFTKTDIGFNWAFVATSNRLLNIGIAEVALPPSTCTATDRTTILKTYALKTVFEKQIKTLYPSLPQTAIDVYLQNTTPPGYFTNGGFVAAGTAPSVTSSAYSEIQARMDNLTPYQPSAISSLSIGFK